MGVGRQHCVREARAALGVGGVKRVDRDPEAAGVAADVVESQQPPVAVEGGVLDALCDHRRARLLKAGHELSRRLAFEQQPPGDAAGHPGAVDRRAVLVGDRARLRIDVGPVDRHRRERELDRP